MNKMYVGNALEAKSLATAEGTRRRNRVLDASKYGRPDEETYEQQRTRYCILDSQYHVFFYVSKIHVRRVFYHHRGSEAGETAPRLIKYFGLVQLSAGFGPRSDCFREEP